jgi:hypothetical protein
MQVWTEPSYQSYDIGAEYVRKDLVKKYNKDYPMIIKARMETIIEKYIVVEASYGSLRGYLSFGPPTESLKKIDIEVTKYLNLINKMKNIIIHYLYKPGGIMQKKVSNRFQKMC